MRQPGLVREFVLRVHDEGLKRIRAYLSRLDPFEREAYTHLDEDYVGKLADLTAHTMRLMGHTSTGDDSQFNRFDKTRRAARAYRKRGELTEEDRLLLEGEPDGKG